MASLANYLPKANESVRIKTNNVYSIHKNKSSVRIPSCISVVRANEAELRAKWLSSRSRLDSQLYDWAAGTYGLPENRSLY